MKTTAKAWAIEYPNGRLMKNENSTIGTAVYSTKSAAQWVIDQLKTKGKPVKVRITVEKVI